MEIRRCFDESRDAHASCASTKARNAKPNAINRHVAEILAQSFSKGWITKLRIGCDNWIIDRNVITTILIQRLTKGLTGFQVDYAPIPIALAQKMGRRKDGRSEEHTSELQSLMRNSYAVFCLK